MKKTQFVDAIKNIRKRFASFLSITLVIAIGTGGFFTTQNIYRSLKETFDGYYAGPDGSWVENVPRLTEDTRPVTGCKYREEGNPTGLYVQFAELEDGRYKVTRTYPTLGFSETYLLDPFGRGAYALAKEGDPETRAHLVVLPDNKTVQMSQAGETQRFIKE